MSEATERFELALHALAADRAVSDRDVFVSIAAAAEEGHGQAALLAAYAAGVGYGCGLDLEAALAWLERAAVLGAADARAQLKVFHAGGDLGAWTHARASHLVNEAPHISLAPGFLDAQLCDWTIERALPLQEPTLVYDPVTGHPVRDDDRSNSAGTFKLTDLNFPVILIRHRIANTLGAPVDHFERSAVFRYRIGQMFVEHADYVSPSFTAEIRERGQRPWTFLVYLNSAFGGGETHFSVIDKKFRGETGDAFFGATWTPPGFPMRRRCMRDSPPRAGKSGLFPNSFATSPSRRDDQLSPRN